ncbi:MAG: 23S rRNA (guanosine(2251)-2'-O)-methyltransferase RlmB [Bacilli bacterium]|nr:23S rRNA (guanosine(2251)-2'-O)-methyltransferase RlmB [Bacilli bacterium]
MLIYGRNVALEVLKKKENIKKVFLQQNFDDKRILSLLEKNKITPIYLEKKEIDDLIDGKHQGIILDIRDYQYKSLEDVSKDDDAVVVILDHIEDPHNLGAIIRTCEAAGIKDIIISKNRQVGVNATVMKTSAGALLNTNVIMVSNIANAINVLKKDGFWVVGTTLADDSLDYREVDYSGRIALVIGNEGKGISDIVSKACDYRVKIPMRGTINSLNASVASGIMIYEVIRNRK